MPADQRLLLTIVGSGGREVERMLCSGGGLGLKGLSRCGAFCGKPGEAWAELVGFPAVTDTLRLLPELG